MLFWMSEIDPKYLLIIEEKLEQIWEMPAHERYGTIIDMIVPVNLSNAERLKLRSRLEWEFDFPTEDFDLVFAS